MTDAVHIMLEWWSLMAEMNAKYGPKAEIETKPEWLKLQETQQELLRVLKKQTNISADILFRSLQHALLEVLGTEETTLSFEEAKEIVELAVRFSIEEETQIAQTDGIRN